MNPVPAEIIILHPGLKTMETVEMAVYHENGFAVPRPALFAVVSALRSP
jgi:hypothetical protein